LSDNAALYAWAFVVPLVVTIALTPIAGRLARRMGLLDQPEERRIHHVATPSLGGLAVGVGLIAVGAAVVGASGEFAVLVLGAVAVTALGLVDDWRGVGPLAKLAVEAGAALALWFSGVGGGLFGNDVLDAALTAVWVIAVMNAVNMIDNMDGLASGIAAISAFGFFAIAALEGDYLVGSLAIATAGAAIGFLWHNFPPAKIFLGDAGSLLLGFLLAALGLKLDLIGESGLVRSAIPLLILAVPLFDLTLVVIARTVDGRPVYHGGTDHSSHRLLGRGLSSRQVALASYSVQAMCAFAAFVLYSAGWGTIAAAAVVAAGLTLIALALLLRAAPLPAIAAGGEPADLDVRDA
jgi:UDP-GlcNAc:undecaprenyl-phosphate GlcNAc-1-phosphate transferase